MIQPLIAVAVAAFWAGAYAVAGWFGVAVMAVIAAAGEALMALASRNRVDG